MGYKYLIRDKSLYKVFQYGVIYKATNKQNNKSYIGQTVEKVNTRRIYHLRDAKINDYKFCRALRKYKDEDWDWSIVHIIKEKENINLLEIEYIKKYDSYNNGYNSTLGGQYLNKKELEEELSIEEVQKARDKRKLNCKKSFNDRWTKFSEEEKEKYRSLRSGKNNKHSKYIYWIFDENDNFLYEVEEFSRFCREQSILSKHFRSSIDKCRSYNGWEVLKVDYGKMECFLNTLNKEEKLKFQIEQIKLFKQRRQEYLENRGEIRNYKIFKGNELIIQVKKFKYLRDFCQLRNINYGTFRGKLYSNGLYEDYRIEIEEYKKQRLRQRKLNVVEQVL